MNDEVGDYHQDQEIIYKFEHEMQTFKVMIHTVRMFYERFIGNNGRDDKDFRLLDEKDIEKIAKKIEEEFKESIEVRRYKSALIALKYDEIAFYFIYKRHAHGRHGNIYVVNGDNVIKTMYLSKDSGWYEKLLIESKTNKRRKFRHSNKAMKGTRRESVYKKDKKGK